MTQKTAPAHPLGEGAGRQIGAAFAVAASTVYHDPGVERNPKNSLDQLRAQVEAAEAEALSCANAGNWQGAKEARRRLLLVQAEIWRLTHPQEVLSCPE